MSDKKKIYISAHACVWVCPRLDNFSPKIDKSKSVTRKGKKVVIYAILFYCITSEKAIIKLFSVTQNFWAKKRNWPVSTCVCACAYMSDKKNMRMFIYIQSDKKMIYMCVCVRVCVYGVAL